MPLPALLLLSLPMKPSPIVRSEFLFERSPFKACHASTLAETREGLVAAWFGGDREGAKNVAIYSSRFVLGGWTPPHKVIGHLGHPCWNPVLFQPRTGPLLLFYKVGKSPDVWTGRMMRSGDGGRTWSDLTKLPEGILGPIKNKPIQLADGTILCPSSEEDGGWRIHFERTADLGETWTRTDALNDPAQIGAIQPSLLPMGGRRLRAVGRTQQGRVFAIDSADDGLSWGAMRLLNLPNPNSGTDALRLADGRYLIVYNDTETGRSPLNVALSKDAERWTNVLDLESLPGEHSYPAVIQTHDGLVHITYTWNRKNVRHVVLDPSRLSVRDSGESRHNGA